MKTNFKFFRWNLQAVIALILFLPMYNLHAQTQSRLWSIPNKMVRFSGTGPAVFNLPAPGGNDYNNQQPLYATNMMHTIQGSPLFFVVDGKVYDRSGLSIGTVTEPSLGVVTGSSEYLIVPDPGNCLQYYLFGTYYRFPNASGSKDPEPYYIKLDISLNNTEPDGNPLAHGDFLNHDETAATWLSGIVTDDVHNNSLHYAVTPVNNGTRFLYISDALHIEMMTIGTNGISAPVTVATLPSGNNSGTLRSEMEIVKIGDASDPDHGNYRLALGYGTNVTNSTSTYKIFLADFNQNTGIEITGSQHALDLPYITSLISATPHGLEFSADGSTLFVSHTQASGMGFYTAPFANGYHDLYNQLVTINGGSSFVSTDFGHGQIEMGYDGKIYFAATNRIGALNMNTSTNPASWTWDNTAITGVNLPLTMAGFGAAYAEEMGQYLLNDQIDGEIYQNYPATAPPSLCCLAGTGFTADTYTANPALGAFQIWQPGSNPFTNSIGTGNTVTIRNQLIIPPGVTVEIRNMVFKFAPRTYINNNVNTPAAGANVVVQRTLSAASLNNGGQLTLNNSTFTSYEDCGQGMWEGIDVEGWSTVAQGSAVNSRQGWLTLLNFSIISNAWHGISVASVTNPLSSVLPTIVNGSGGGIVKATSSNFVNNYMSVFFSPYDYLPASNDNNMSYFTLNNFKTSQALHDYYFVVHPTVGPYAQAFLLVVKGIPFQGNKFSTDLNSSPYTILSNNTGIGIWSLNSNFSVLPTSTLVRNQFLNLNYGIAAANINSTRTILVDRSDFLNNYRGVYISGVNFATITRNKFEVYKWPYLNPNEAYGIYTNYCRGFKIEENDFQYSGPPTPIASSFGIIVNQSNPARSCGLHDQIYKNTFHSIDVGIQTQGNNSEAPFAACHPYSTATPNAIGLVLQCNKLFSNMDDYDFRVGDYQTVMGNIASAQGDCSLPTSPANNQFSHTCPHPTSSYSIDGTFTPLNPNAISFYTWSSNNVILPLSPAPCYTLPVTASGVNLGGCAAYTYSDAGSCPSSFILHPTPLFQRQQIAYVQAKIDSINGILAGGDAPLLYTIIAGGNPGQIQTALMAKSPYLSDQVLIAAIQHNLPAGNLKNIILGNSPVSSEVMNALNGINIPNGIRNQINAAQVGVSVRTQLIGLLDSYLSMKSENVNGLIRIFLNDSTLNNGVDSVLEVFSKYQVPEYKCEMVKGYLDEKDSLAASALTDTLEQIGGMGDFCLFTRALLQLQSYGNSYMALPANPQMTSEITAVASVPTERVSADANTLLQLVYHYEFNEYINPFAAYSERNASPSEVSPLSDPSGYSQLYPNPNNGTMMFSYNLPSGATGMLNIYDINGKKVDSHTLKEGQNVEQISDDQLENGIYFFEYLVNAERVNAGRIAIVK